MTGAKTAGLLIATTMFAGCSSLGPIARQENAGPVGPSYVAGRGVQMFPASPTVMTDVKDAMSDVGIHSIRQVREPDNTDAFEGTTADNRRVHVAVQPRGTRMVVSTKVGWRGDEALSRAVLDRISIRQGTLPASAVAVEPVAPAPDETAANPFVSQGAVSDATMLRGQLESGYSQSPVP